LLSLARTLVSLQEIPDSRKVTTSRLDTRERSGNCEIIPTWSLGITGSLNLTLRTDNAVLATNGFAADGQNFVKRVKQRLEVGVVV
jgi:hypothetical protein